jgi:hypothetical protein
LGGKSFIISRGPASSRQLRSGIQIFLILCCESASETQENEALVPIGEWTYEKRTFGHEWELDIEIRIKLLASH